MLCYITYAKIFHSFFNFAAGFCSQKIREAMKNCALFFLAALLFFPVPKVFAQDFDVVPRAAKPVPPEGYEQRQIIVTSDYINSSVYTFTSSGIHTQSVRFFLGFAQNALQSVDINNVWNKTLYLEYISVPNKLEDKRTTSTAGTWTSYSTTHAQPVTGGNFTLEQLNGTSASGTISSNLYFPYVWNNRALNLEAKVSSKVNVGFNSQKIQFRTKFTLKFIYFFHVGTDTDHIIDAVGDAANKIVGAVNNQGNKINNNLNLIQTGIGTVNTNLGNINTSIKNGFNDTINNIKQQTTSITNNANQNADKITANQDENTQKILDQNSQFRDEDRAEAEGIGKIAQDFLDTNVSKARSNFSILWEPIAFTQRVISVFSGGTRSDTYSDYLDGVVGFNYNPDTGCLDPILDLGPKSRYGKASGGTTITFPSYTLPVLNLKIWDSYTFDLKTVKDNFPVLFNAIYVVSGCLCLYWFLGFLSDKFEEVFKE